MKFRWFLFFFFFCSIYNVRIKIEEWMDFIFFIFYRLSKIRELLALTNNERRERIWIILVIRCDIIKIFGYFVEINNSIIFNCVYNINKSVTFHEILNTIRWM